MKWHHAKRQEKKRRDLLGGGLIFFGLFLGLSLLSYNSSDPSFNSLGIDLKVTNYCGYVGAFLADLFYQIFGLTSWIFVLGSFALAFKLFRSSSFVFPFFANTSLFFIFVASLSCLLELYFSKTLFYENSISVGGVLGTVLLKGLKPLFHPVGTTVLLWAILVLSLIFYGEMSFKAFFEKSLQIFSFLRTKSFLFLKKGFFFFKGKTFFKSIKIPSFKKSTPLLQEEGRVSQSPPSPEREFPFEPSPQPEGVKEISQRGLQEELPPQLLEETFLTPKPRAFKNFPSLDFLIDPPSSSLANSAGPAEILSKKLVSKLAQFSIEGRVTAIKLGPAVTLFEFKPNDNVKVNRIKEMANDISLALSSESVRIIAPIPGRDVVGIEISNSSRERVYLKTLIEHSEFLKAKIPLLLGKRADNQICVEDLSRLPHLLVAGTTGSGKSVFVINFIMGLLYRYMPEDMKLILIDPKQVDLSVFKDIPHLLAPPITSSSETVKALRWLSSEMEKRYRSLAEFGVRDLAGFNEAVEKMTSSEKIKHQSFQNENPESYYFEKLPLICVVIEEFGDLMMDPQFKKPVETFVVRLAQKARASGIHLVLAMQSPRKDVITGLIKTNIPGRISFKVSSSTDSRVILDEGGAERLLSQGDMLFLKPGTSKPLRFHGPYVSEGEVSKVVSFWKEEGKPEEEKNILETSEEESENTSFFHSEKEEADSMYDEIKNFVRTQKVVSASFLQRKFRIGYPRAARLIEILYEAGEIGPPQGSKPREVIIHK